MYSGCVLVAIRIFLKIEGSMVLHMVVAIEVHHRAERSDQQHVSPQIIDPMRGVNTSVQPIMAQDEQAVVAVAYK